MQLPDGQEIHVGTDRFKVPELLFQPGLMSSYPGVKPTSTGTAAALHSEETATLGFLVSDKQSCGVVVQIIIDGVQSHCV